MAIGCRGPAQIQASVRWARLPQAGRREKQKGGTGALYAKRIKGMVDDRKGNREKPDELVGSLAETVTHGHSQLYCIRRWMSHLSQKKTKAC